MVTCSAIGCTTTTISGKSFCLQHHKEQDCYNYGLDHDLQLKMAAKWDDQKAKMVLHWLSLLVNRPIEGEDFHSELKSGVVLCEALNRLFPNSIKQINKSNISFAQRENLSFFNAACRANGLHETDCFMSDDLYEKRNLLSVCNSLIALGQLAKDRKCQAPILSVDQFTASAPININDEVKASKEAAKGVLNPAIPPYSAKIIVSKVPKALFCGECGAKRTSGRFCSECGKALQ